MKDLQRKSFQAVTIENVRRETVSVCRLLADKKKPSTHALLSDEHQR